MDGQTDGQSGVPIALHATKIGGHIIDIVQCTEESISQLLPNASPHDLQGPPSGLSVATVAFWGQILGKVY